ncbi:DUF4296 domain-containing protein [Flavobacteriaceae bacterium Ap0902]|nr:DUF4296 domain-containing protein [Flavobacteriaceae bacterium Ap0902]
MRFLKVILLSIILVLTSCNEEVEKPDSLIPKEEMKAILKDIYIYRNLNEVSLAKEDKINLDDVNLAVLKKHDQTFASFIESYKYYVIAHASFDEMLVEIKDEISQDEAFLIKDTIPQTEKNN